MTLPIGPGAGAVEVASAAPLGRRRRRRRVFLAAGLGVLAVVVGTLVALRWGGGKAPDTAEAPGPAVQTVAIRRTDLSTARTANGELGFGPARKVTGADGTITWLPAVGLAVQRGTVLYRRDDRPVMAFFGATPLFRRLETPNLVGRDVRVVVDNLRKLGYPVGRQPRAGRVITLPVTGDARSGASGQGSGAAGQPDPLPSASAEGAGETAAPATAPARVTVRKGDGVLTADVVAAVKKWQKAVGLVETGVVEPTDVVVLPGPARVSGISAQLGDPAAEGVLAVTGTDKVVTVGLDAAEAGSVRAGDAVEVELPGGTTAPARVSRVNTDAQVPPSADGDVPATESAEVGITVVLDDAKAVRKLNSAPVEVTFTGETRTGVLAVPVAALLALREGGYAVQIADGPLTAVETGMFAMGMVEISGDGIGEGTRVVTV
jgi:hypothetical protein